MIIVAVECGYPDLELLLLAQWLDVINVQLDVQEYLRTGRTWLMYSWYGASLGGQLGHIHHPT